MGATAGAPARDEALLKFLALRGKYRRAALLLAEARRVERGYPVGAGNSAVVVDLPRWGPMLSPRVPNLVPIPGPRMERETPGQRPRPNYGHPHAGCARCGCGHPQGDAEVQTIARPTHQSVEMARRCPSARATTLRSLAPPRVNPTPVGAHNSVVGADQGFRAPSWDQESVHDAVHEDSASARIATGQRPRPSFRHPHASSNTPKSTLDKHRSIVYAKARVFGTHWVHH